MDIINEFADRMIKKNKKEIVLSRFNNASQKFKDMSISDIESKFTSMSKVFELFFRMMAIGCSVSTEMDDMISGFIGDFCLTRSRSGTSFYTSQKFYNQVKEIIDVGAKVPVSRFISNHQIRNTEEFVDLVTKIMFAKNYHLFFTQQVRPQSSELSFFSLHAGPKIAI